MTASIRSSSPAPTRSIRAENRIAAVRGWAEGRWGGWTVSADASYLDSANRNFLAGAPQNQHLWRPARARRPGLAPDRRPSPDHRRRASGGGFPRPRHRLFRRHQPGSRRATSLPSSANGARNGADWASTDVAVRHDSFSAFDDATTLRASLLVRPTGGLSLHAAYGEGIAQPTFYDLYGFFPGSFVGNPALTARTSRGWEAGIALARTRASASPRPISRRGSGTRSSTCSIPPPSSRAPPTQPARAAARASSSPPPDGAAGWLTLCRTTPGSTPTSSAPPALRWCARSGGRGTAPISSC